MVILMLVSKEKNMFLLPIFFGFVFLLLGIYKLLGGDISNIYIILSGALFIIPIILFIIYWIKFNIKK